MQHFTCWADVPQPLELLASAKALKQNPWADEGLGKHRTLGLIFFNPSLRTRLSTQKAAYNLGMQVIAMDINEQGWKIETQDGAIMNGDKAEHIKDAVGVMGQYCDIIGVRTFATLSDQEQDYQDFTLEQFKKYAGVPIVSLESAIRHPLQSLADWLTIEEHKTRPRPKVVLTWAPHPKALPQAVANSFAEWMQNTDYEFVITHPEGYELAEEFSQNVQIEYDQNKAFENADFIYAKNWSNYKNYGKVLNQDMNWTVSAQKMQLTNQAKFMHCLPVRRNVVVMDEVIDGSHSIILPQAQNRVFSAQAVLKALLQR
ncbi:MAG: N-acetylornithine carbamoyltransferase [Microscillaceae bacterium]|nr:N-acetylornithine carbamoyltransferase [Microscillaceae bacterium]